MPLSQALRLPLQKAPQDLQLHNSWSGTDCSKRALNCTDNINENYDDIDNKNDNKKILVTTR